MSILQSNNISQAIYQAVTQGFSALMLVFLAVGSAQALEAEKVASGFNIPWGLAYVDDSTC